MIIIFVLFILRIIVCFTDPKLSTKCHYKSEETPFNCITSESGPVYPGSRSSFEEILLVDEENFSIYSFARRTFDAPIRREVEGTSSFNMWYYSLLEYLPDYNKFEPVYYWDSSPPQEPILPKGFFLAGGVYNQTIFLHANEGVNITMTTYSTSFPIIEHVWNISVIPNGPSQREFSGRCVSGKAIYIHQGWSVSEGNLNGMYEFNMEEQVWTEMPENVQVEPNRGDHSMVFNKATDSLFVFGGVSDAFTNISASLGDLWKYDISSTNEWAEILPLVDTYGVDRPEKRFGSLLFSFLDNLYIFSGSAYGEPINDLWSINTTSFSEFVEIVSYTIPAYAEYPRVPQPVRPRPEEFPWPGGREFATGITFFNNLFVSGGRGYVSPDESTEPVYLADLWRISLDPYDVNVVSEAVHLRTNDYISDCYCGDHFNGSLGMCKRIRTHFSIENQNILDCEIPNCVFGEAVVVNAERRIFECKCFDEWTGDLCDVYIGQPANDMGLNLGARMVLKDHSGVVYVTGKCESDATNILDILDIENNGDEDLLIRDFTTDVDGRLIVLVDILVNNITISDRNEIWAIDLETKERSILVTADTWDGRYFSQIVHVPFLFDEEIRVEGDLGRRETTEVEPNWDEGFFPPQKPLSLFFVTDSENDQIYYFFPDSVIMPLNETAGEYIGCETSWGTFYASQGDIEMVYPYALSHAGYTRNRDGGIEIVLVGTSNNRMDYWRRAGNQQIDGDSYFVKFRFHPSELPITPGDGGGEHQSRRRTGDVIGNWCTERCESIKPMDVTVHRYGDHEATIQVVPDGDEIDPYRNWEYEYYWSPQMAQFDNSWAIQIKTDCYYSEPFISANPTWYDDLDTQTARQEVGNCYRTVNVQFDFWQFWGCEWLQRVPEPVIDFSWDHAQYPLTKNNNVFVCYSWSNESESGVLNYFEYLEESMVLLKTEEAPGSYVNISLSRGDHFFARVKYLLFDVGMTKAYECSANGKFCPHMTSLDSICTPPFDCSKDCGGEHGQCVDIDVCECFGNPDNYVPDLEPVCTTCINNFDISTDCTRCKNEFWDVEKACAGCLNDKLSLADECLSCSNPLRDITGACLNCTMKEADPDSECLDCLDARFELNTDCEECKNELFDPNFECNACVVPGMNFSSGCSECTNSSSFGKSCQERLFPGPPFAFYDEKNNIVVNFQMPTLYIYEYMLFDCSNVIHSFVKRKFVEGEEDNDDGIDSELLDELIVGEVDISNWKCEWRTSMYFTETLYIRNMLGEIFGDSDSDNDDNDNDDDDSDIERRGEMKLKRLPKNYIGQIFLRSASLPSHTFNVSIAPFNPPQARSVGEMSVADFLRENWWIFLLIVGVICAIVIVFVGALTGTLAVNVKQKKSLEKFGDLEDVDILLEEQKLAKEGGTAQLKVNKSLFEINYEDLEIDRMIGSGGSNSKVYKSKWNGKFVAFKCFQVQTFTDNDIFSEFEKEVNILININHPHILQFFGATLKPPRVGFIMEFCELGDLKCFLRSYNEKNGRMYPVEEKTRMLIELASAFQYIHKLNILHRDIKPENVLINKAEETKLMDFGLSKVIKDAVTKTMMIGTSFYMAPEIVYGNDYDNKCDVFSFAIMMWVVFTEEFSPYGNTTTVSVELEVARDKNFRPSLENKPIPEQLVPTIVRCWDDDPTVRMDFKELSEQLVKFREEKMKGVDKKEIEVSETEVRRLVGENERLGKRNFELEKQNKEYLSKLYEFEKKVKEMEKAAAGGAPMETGESVPGSPQVVDEKEVQPASQEETVQVVVQPEVQPATSTADSIEEEKSQLVVPEVEEMVAPKEEGIQ